MDQAGVSSSLDAFLDLTFRHLVESLMDIRGLAAGLAENNETPGVCHLLDCPRLERLTKALRDTITILEKTKGSFKSKELKDLRQQLEGIVNEEKELTTDRPLPLNGDEE